MKAEQRKVLLIIGVVLVLFATISSFIYRSVRNRWPKAITARVAELRASGKPVTTEELNARYGTLVSDPNAVEHFEKTFAALSTNTVPFFGTAGASWRSNLVNPLPEPIVLRSSEPRGMVASYIAENRAALELLREGRSYGPCHFSIDLTAGFDARLPHLPRYRKSAQLLSVAAIDSTLKGEGQAIERLRDSLHMADLLKDEPLLISMLIRDSMLVATCFSLRTCLDLGPLPERDLVVLSEELRAIATRNDIPPVLTAERCVGLSIYFGSNQKIADTIAQGATGAFFSWIVEYLRVSGNLQRDCQFFMQSFDRLEAAGSGPSFLSEIAAIASEIEHNKGLVSENVRRVNIISGMLLPSTLKGLRGHMEARSFLEATVASLAIERYRNGMGDLPQNWEALIPKYLHSVPRHPFTAEPLIYRRLDTGYEVRCRRINISDLDTPSRANLKSHTADVVLRAYR